MRKSGTLCNIMALRYISRLPGVIVLALLALTSCTSSPRSRVYLRMFFDGVPSEAYYAALTNRPFADELHAVGKSLGPA